MEPGRKAPGVEAAEMELLKKSSCSEVHSGLFLDIRLEEEGLNALLVLSRPGTLKSSPIS